MALVPNLNRKDTRLCVFSPLQTQHVAVQCPRGTCSSNEESGLPGRLKGLALNRNTLSRNGLDRDSSYIAWVLIQGRSLVTASFLMAVEVATHFHRLLRCLAGTKNFLNLTRIGTPRAFHRSTTNARQISS